MEGRRRLAIGIRYTCKNVLSTVCVCVGRESVEDRRISGIVDAE